MDLVDKKNISLCFVQWPSLILAFTMEICVYFTILCSVFIIYARALSIETQVYSTINIELCMVEGDFSCSFGFSNKILKLRKKEQLNCRLMSLFAIKD